MKCEKCNDEKPAGDFYATAPIDSPTRAWCKACISVAYRKAVDPIRANRKKKWDGDGAHRRQMEEGEYQCSKCQAWKAPVDYTPSALANRMIGFRAMCKACSAANMRAYRARKNTPPEDNSDLA